MEGDRQGTSGRSNYPQGYPQNHGTQAGHTADVQQLRAGPGGGTLDRFAQGQMLTTRPAAPAPLGAGIGVAHDIGTFTYSQGQPYQALHPPQLQTPTFQYQSDYIQDSQRPRFAQYPSQMAFNVPQQPHTQSPYETVPQYQPSQTAAMDILSSQFGAQAHYFSASDTPNPPAPAAMPQDYQTMAYQQPMQYTSQSGLGRSTLASSYPTMTLEGGQAGGNEFAGAAGMAADIAVENNDRYYHAIRETNHRTYRGTLVQAGDSLMQISNWLLTNAVRLGFTTDDQSMYAQRLKLWDDFNNCWLALLQRQLDDTQRMLGTGHPPSSPQNLLPVETLERMGDELVAHCDNLGRVGLVDYQMGVSEEDIIDILNRCIDLLRPHDDSRDEPGQISNPDLSRRRRSNY